MVLNTSGNNGKVTFKIAVPKISADTNLTLTYGSETEDFTGVTVLAKKPTALNTLVEAANWLYYEKVLTVAPGNYDFELSYNEGTKIGGAIVSMTVLPGVEDYVIWGTIENGEYQVASLRLIVPSVEITALTPSVSAVAGFVTVAKDDELTFTATTDPADATKTWFINGSSASAYVNNGTLTVPTGKPGVYVVVCKATKDNAVKYKGQTVIVTP